MKAAQLVASGKIARTADGYSVPSQSGAEPYRVVLDGLFPSCTCADFELRGGADCKHMLAVRHWLGEQITGQPAARMDPTARIPRKTYPRLADHQPCADDREELVPGAAGRPVSHHPRAGAEELPGPANPIRRRGVRGGLQGLLGLLRSPVRVRPGRRPRAGPHRRADAPLQQCPQRLRQPGRDPDPVRPARPQRVPAPRGRVGMGGRFDRLRHVAVRAVVRPEVRHRPGRV